MHARFVIVSGSMMGKNQKDGFTIVELLIVVVVIGILAAVTIIAYNGVQNRAKTATLQSDVSSSLKKIESYRVTTGSDLFPSDLAAAGLIASSGTTYKYDYSVEHNAYCLTATNGTQSYFVSSLSKVVTEGTCVMNFITNPSFEVATTSTWSENGGRSTSRLARGPTSGSYRIEVTNNSGVVSTILYRQNGNGISFTEGNILTVSATVSSVTGNFSSVRMRIDWRNSAGVPTATGTVATGSAVTLTPGEYKRISLTSTAPPTAAYGRVAIVADNTPLASVVSIDAVMATSGATLYPYGDGDSTGWLWFNGAHNSISVGPSS